MGEQQTRQIAQAQDFASREVIGLAEARGVARQRREPIEQVIHVHGVLERLSPADKQRRTIGQSAPPSGRLRMMVMA